MSDFAAIVNGVRFPLLRLADDDWRKLLRREEIAGLVGFPICWNDLSGKVEVWPRPATAVKIVCGTSA